MAFLRHLLKRPSALHIYASCSTWTHGPIAMSEEVDRAIRKKQPVVALETTIVTHGMPYPDNLKISQEVEAIVRDLGAVPATIGLHGGHVHVGMPSDVLETLARLGEKCTKVSRRDLPAVLSKGLAGGTTVSATMAICHVVGIPIFATGGIGGVHRGGESTMDISADLLEMGRTPVTVVSAGVKSILDIGRTLEFLETQGVCVVTYGSSRDFPAFFLPKSGHRSPWNVESPPEAASLIASRDALGLTSGILVAVPIPESSAADAELVERAVGTAVREAEAKGILGSAVTSYVLKRVVELTEGASLRANVALIKNNAAVGARIAVALSERRDSFPVMSTWSSTGGNTGRPVVVGGSNVDITARITEDDVKLNGSTHRGQVRLSYGGVGRNLADCMSRLLGDRRRPRFVSVVGKDDHGDALLRHNAHMDLTGVVQLQNRRTATYIGVLDKAGECRLGIGDMDIHQEITVSQIQKNEGHILSAPVVATDGNIPTETLSYVVNMCRDKKIPVWFEPTDIRKAVRPFSTDTWKGLSYVSPNMAELRVIHPLVADTGDERSTSETSQSATEESVVHEALHLSAPLLRYLLGVLVTLGRHGALFVCRKDRQSEIQAWHCPVLQGVKVNSVSGAGDCLAAAMMCAMLDGLDVQQRLAVAMRVAALSVASLDAVPGTVEPSCLVPDEGALLQPRRLPLPSSIS